MRTMEMKEMKEMNRVQVDARFWLRLPRDIDHVGSGFHALHTAKPQLNMAQRCRGLWAQVPSVSGAPDTSEVQSHRHEAEAQRLIMRRVVPKSMRVPSRSNRRSGLRRRTKTAPVVRNPRMKTENRSQQHTALLFFDCALSPVTFRCSFVLDAKAGLLDEAALMAVKE